MRKRRTSARRRFPSAILTILLLLAGLAVTILSELPARLPGSPLTLEVFLRSPPADDGGGVTEINGNFPLFTLADIDGIRDIQYSPLDELGRCGTAAAYIGPETIPTEKRGPIGSIRPTGWQTVRYDDLIEDKYLYNRCHLIGYQLAGGNDDPLNLITGTRWLNISGMLPYENQIFSFVSQTGEHVIYRVTPVFRGNNPLASGVLMEALSAEDGGAGLSFCVYVPNMQPGIVIDYTTGDSRRAKPPGEETAGTAVIPFLPAPMTADNPAPDRNSAETDECAAPATYVLNTHTHRFHDPSCPSVTEMNEKNRQPFYGTREEAVDAGYIPCGRCRP